MPSAQQERNFASEMQDAAEAEITIKTWALDKAIEFIGDELDPEDVFSEKKLEQWAESNGYTKE